MTDCKLLEDTFKRIGIEYDIKKSESEVWVLIDDDNTIFVFSKSGSFKEITQLI